MPRFSAETAECTVFTYKEGLLSAVAHDLKIAVTRFSIDVSAGGSSPASIQAEFDAASLRVVTAMHDGQPAPQLLGEADRRKIEHNIVTEVLEADRYPHIRFVSEEIVPAGDGFEIRGQLSLHGQTRTLRCTALPAADRYEAEVRLHQPDFGIKPYTALFGTLRIRPDVTVRVSVPKAGL